MHIYSFINQYHHDDYFDAGIIQRGGDEKARYYMADRNCEAKEIKISGTASKDLIQYYVDQGWEYDIKRQGVHLLRINGDAKVVGYDTKTRYLGGRIVKGPTRFTINKETMGDVGDSGSPMFTVSGDYGYIAGIFWGRTNDGNGPQAFTSITDIKNRYNLRIPQ